MRWTGTWGLLLASAAVCAAQTTQGLVAGRIVDSLTGGPVAGVRVTARREALDAAARSDRSGYFTLPLLSPGVYEVALEASGGAVEYRPLRSFRIELAVAARVDLEIELRPMSDVWELGQFRGVFLPGSKTLASFYGPDLDTSRSSSFDPARQEGSEVAASVSQLIRRDEIAEVPLQGRDAYTMLITQPGVTSDAATARGLGLTVNGQRPTAANFLLDGVENNNYLVTGPVTVVAPEAIGEYRISTNNFSAEYGRTSGFLANALTRAGGPEWHGVVYSYLKNPWLNGRARPVKEIQPGFWAGGPAKRDRLFVSAALEYFRFSGEQDPLKYTLPTAGYVAGLPADGLVRGLFQRYQGAVATAGSTYTTVLSAPSTDRRLVSVDRADLLWHGGEDRLMVRVNVSRDGRPDFFWTPYPDYVSPLNQNSLAGAAGYVRSRGAFTLEARQGWTRNLFDFRRSRPDLPQYVVSGVTVPGSPEAYSYRNTGDSAESATSLTWTGGRHVPKVGAGVFPRNLGGSLSLLASGQLTFTSLATFAQGKVFSAIYPVSRKLYPQPIAPTTDREYAALEYYAFVQDSFKIHPRLVLTYGARYDHFGAPENKGSQADLLVVLTPGFPSRFTGSGARGLYTARAGAWAGRGGVAWRLDRSGSTVLRIGYGIYYDRSFDNLWQTIRNNDFRLRGALVATSVAVDITNPLSGLLSLPNSVQVSTSSLLPTVVRPGLRNPYVGSAMATLERSFGPGLTVDLHYLGSRGRELLTSDVINRAVPLNEFVYRANQGSSEYHALAASARVRSGRGELDVTYSWSHSIDNQSEPLGGDFLNFNVVSGGSALRSAFASEGDSRADRGSSDFDQRQSVTAATYWKLPGGWTVGGLAAVRSGFPFSVYSATSLPPFEGNRANLVVPAQVYKRDTAGVGVQWLNAAAFGSPTRTLGTSGRNAFVGPGFYNADASLSRTFVFERAGGVRVNVRADAYNLLNHENLGNPDPFLSHKATFGLSKYGRAGVSSGRRWFHLARWGGRSN